MQAPPLYTRHCLQTQDKVSNEMVKKIETSFSRELKNKKLSNS